MSDKKWIERLTEKYEWAESEPSPEVVVEEAKKRNIDSIDFLINKMDDASGRSETIPKTGYVRWKWFRNWRDAYLGTPNNDK